ncbi:hypothetical protein [Alkalihalobacillus trypoxylicola]|uniref:Uncharacterized protein n=1 Tax=Alkalihalobacillus trypoxylicola TaxID=519424 RepID=A0A162D1P4_9BACI|nr:hypothetical protein [Alkalihalobacillus trypoxylicola]KYG27741.1 hypothetical protein AZF04_11170 [Alkalihalobacillus trypoxylicola]
MAKYTIIDLFYGRDHVAEFYKSARNEWSNIFSDQRSKTVDGLAELLTEKEESFKANCGHGNLGAEILAWSGFIYFYDAQEGLRGENGFQARQLEEAFQKSHCSEGVKKAVEQASNVFFSKL